MSLTYYLHAHSLYLETSHKPIMMFTAANSVHFTNNIWLGENHHYYLLWPRRLGEGKQFPETHRGNAWQLASWLCLFCSHLGPL